MSLLNLVAHVEAVHVGPAVKAKDRVWRAWVELAGVTVHSVGYVKTAHPYEAERLVVREFAERLARVLDDPPYDPGAVE